MTWIKIVLLLLQIADTLFKRQHDNGLVQEGEDRAVAMALLAMQSRSTTLKALDEKRATMTPEEIMRELEGNHDFRD